MEPVNLNEPVRYVRQSPWQTAILNWLSSRIFWVSIAATLVLTGWLIYYASHFASTPQISPEQAQAASEMMGKLRVALTAAIVVFGISFSVFFAGDAMLAFTLFGVAALYYFAPDLLPMTGLIPEAAVSNMMELTQQAVGSIRFAGIFLGAGALIYQIIDVSIRVRQRVKYGGREEALKQTEVKEEDDEIRNVFLGKCWQLPFCRKFVRQSCPIYHSRRCCWRERVGCMCEESVILDALKGKVIPKDAVAAAKYIPQNTRLSPEQKAERCRNCVIYNAHQRQKYQLLLPIAIAATAGAYLAFHPALINTTHRALADIDSAVSRLAFTTAEEGKELMTATPGFIEEVMLILVMLFFLAQIVRGIEFAVFKLKI
ncbi:MAG: hypothetical protein ABIV13_03605 [Fimbriimonadales bacterium]